MSDTATTDTTNEDDEGPTIAESIQGATLGLLESQLDSCGLNEVFRELDCTDMDSNTYTIEGNHVESPITVTFDKYGADGALTFNSIESLVEETMTKYRWALGSTLLSSVQPETPEGTTFEASSTTDQPVIDGVGVLKRRGNDYNPDTVLVAGTRNETDSILDLIAGSESSKVDIVLDDHGILPDDTVYVVDTDYFGYEAIRQEPTTNVYVDQPRTDPVVRVWFRASPVVVDPSAGILVQWDR